MERRQAGPAEGRRSIATTVWPGGVVRYMGACTETDCDREATVRLHVPWAVDRNVCTAHARALVQRDGVVATPLDDAADAWG